ncbi:MAG: transcription-repair coupling factor [Coprococcus sp.]
MKAFTQPLHELSEYEQIVRDIAGHQTPIHIDGCIDSQKCHLISSLGETYPLKLIITYNEIKAKEIYEDYQFFDRNVFFYPAKDIIFYNADIHSNLIVSQRMAVVRRLLDGDPVTVVTTIDGLFDRLLPLEQLNAYRMIFRQGDILPMEILQKKLISMGFLRVSQVEGPGQFAVRGGILDIYNLADDCPYRIELWGDEIDSIRSFDAESQRSIEQVEEMTVYPASEYILTRAVLDRGLKLIDREAKAQIRKLKDGGSYEAASRLSQVIGELRDNLDIGCDAVNLDSYAGYFFNETASFLDYFEREDSLIIVDEPSRVAEKGEAVAAEYRESMSGRLEKGYILPGQAAAIRDYKEVLAAIAGMRTVLLSTLGYNFPQIPIKNKYSMMVSSMHTYRGDFELLVKELTRWKKNKYKVILVCRSETRARRLVKDLAEYDLTAFYSDDRDRILDPGEIMIIHGNLHRGIEYPMIRFAIIAETDIFGEEKKKRQKRRQSAVEGEKIRSFKDLSIGDYVVHESHGVGVYRGIENIEVDGVAKDYIKIEYGGGSNLYILATNLDLIQKYADKEAKQVKVHKLGGQEWHRTKTKVKGAVKELALDLVKLYAARQSMEGYVCGPDTVWQKEFEELFPYEETQDQLDAIEAVKKDMESSKIMDRLICGDVGFGKTEVAIRAAFKMIQEGRQCAVLVPTTILAQQHYNTFLQRMKDYPVNIGLLCRFRTRAEQKETLAGLKAGRVDIVIGTHRLLSKDVEFKNLGLLVVDEEQRFGVSHKEKIKKLKETVDVLTLTATPIPRTMHMSLIGIRDMSLLEEAPVDRLPIQTYVMEYNDEMVREAILREIARGGQVYYVYNRVNGIDEMTAQIAELVPDAAVAFAHGQMSERELEKIMYQFINGEIDVLVSTTIIETGLDISNVNTIIIHDADKLGLSQLYQLRGRVGRSSRTAYAFLMYRRDKMLREVAEKRLSAIREFTELGSGYRIAMRDLEIRGAGNLLGEKQSGHMEAVGYDLYCKLLNTAVMEAKGEKIQEDFETSVEIDIDAFIPATYIRNEFQKLDMYKRIASIQNEEEYGEILDELIDRFGELPKPAANLLLVALIRAEAHAAGVIQLVHKDKVTRVYMHERAEVDVAAIPDLLNAYGKRMKLKSDTKNPYFTVDMKGFSGQNLLMEEKQLVENMLRILCHREVGN